MNTINQIISSTPYKMTDSYWTQMWFVIETGLLDVTRQMSKCPAASRPSSSQIKHPHKSYQNKWALWNTIGPLYKTQLLSPPKKKVKKDQILPRKPDRKTSVSWLLWRTNKKLEVNKIQGETGTSQRKRYSVIQIVKDGQFLVVFMSFRIIRHAFFFNTKWRTGVYISLWLESQWQVSIAFKYSRQSPHARIWQNNLCGTGWESLYKCEPEVQSTDGCHDEITPSIFFLNNQHIDNLVHSHHVINKVQSQKDCNLSCKWNNIIFVIFFRVSSKSYNP